MKGCNILLVCGSWTTTRILASFFPLASEERPQALLRSLKKVPVDDDADRLLIQVSPHFEKHNSPVENRHLCSARQICYFFSTFVRWMCQREGPPYEAQPSPTRPYYALRKSLIVMILRLSSKLVIRIMHRRAELLRSFRGGSC